jgi:hypothetical protein
VEGEPIFCSVLSHVPANPVPLPSVRFIVSSLCEVEPSGRFTSPLLVKVWPSSETVQVLSEVILPPRF